MPPLCNELEGYARQLELKLRGLLVQGENESEGGEESPMRTRVDCRVEVGGLLEEADEVCGRRGRRRRNGICGCAAAQRSSKWPDGRGLGATGGLERRCQIAVWVGSNGGGRVGLVGRVGRVTDDRGVAWRCSSGGGGGRGVVGGC